MSLSLLCKAATVFTASFSVSNAVLRGGQRGSPEWNYNNVESWGNDNPMCKGEGPDARQSPINIMKEDAERGNGKRVLMYDYHKVDGMKLENNGHSLQVTGDFGTLKLPKDRTLKLTENANADSDAEAEWDTYEAKQFNFHFPSEHKFDQRERMGELHIIHQKQGSTGMDDLAVIAIFLRWPGQLDAQRNGPGPKDDFIKFFQDIGLESTLPAKGASLDISTPVDLRDFDYILGGDFFHYQGSLTTPPCSETVRWFVMESGAAVTGTMIDNFMNTIGDNSRPLQDRNGREIVKDAYGVKLEYGGSPYASKGTPTVGSDKDEAGDLDEHAHEWSYNNTDEWVNMEADCGGVQQSPIDLTYSNMHNKGESEALSVSYSAMSDRLTTNQRHTIQVDGNFGTLSFKNKEYKALQFHFHFPSEHSIDGQLSTGELQIVHQVEGSEGTQNMAKVSILLRDTDHVAPDSGAINGKAFMDSIGFKANTLPEVHHSMRASKEVDLSILERILEGPYAHYSGSLTTPPCSETVEWFVFETPMSISSAHAWEFSRALDGVENNRPLQPLNGRKVHEYNR